MNDDARLAKARAFWNKAAATFDEESDHGLRDPAVRQRWAALLERWLPTPPDAVLDIGCGTGSLTILLAGLGYRMTGVDLSPAMLTQARAKAVDAGVDVSFHVQDAASPVFPPEHFSAILCRHVLWTLPEPTAVLKNWAALLKTGGTLILIEGFWHTGSGLHAQQVQDALPPVLSHLATEDLSRDPLLWGGPVGDERFAVVATRAPTPAGRSIGRPQHRA